MKIIVSFIARVWSPHHFLPLTQRQARGALHTPRDDITCRLAAPPLVWGPQQRTIAWFPISLVFSCTCAFLSCIYYFLELILLRKCGMCLFLSKAEERIWCYPIVRTSYFQRYRFSWWILKKSGMTQRKLQNWLFAAVSHFFLPNPPILLAMCSYLVTVSLVKKILHLLLLGHVLLFHTVNLKELPKLNGFPYLGVRL